MARYITGSVRDSVTKVGIAGATVSVKGTIIDTITDVYGFYSINAPEGDIVLVATFLGYKKEEQNVSSSKNKVDFLLKEDIL
jgi:hypothetical protein